MELVLTNFAKEIGGRWILLINKRFRTTLLNLAPVLLARKRYNYKNNIETNISIKYIDEDTGNLVLVINTTTFNALL